VILAIKVVPRASKPGIAVEPDGSLKVRLQSPPVDGAANAELIEALSDFFHVSRRAVTITGGAHSRTKRVRIEGVDALPTSSGGEGQASRPRRTLRR
jgi:uncharacterized protein (TIGR00251 family)